MNHYSWRQHPLVGCGWITGFTCLWVYLLYRMWADWQINLSYCVYSTIKSRSFPLFLHHRHLPFIYNIVHVLTCKMQKVTHLKHRHQNMTPKYLCLLWRNICTFMLYVSYLYLFSTIWHIAGKSHPWETIELSKSNTSFNSS